MKQIPLYLLSLMLLLLIGCQRNTNELPTRNLQFVKTAYSTSNDARLDAYFTEHVAYQPYTLSVHFKAKPGVSLTNARVLVSIYNDTANYNTVPLPTPIAVKTLTASAISAESMVSTNPSFPIDTTHINVYLLTDSLHNLPYSGYYPTGMVTDSFIDGTVSEYPVKGIIDAGGYTYLLMKDDALLIATGILIDTHNFLDGRLAEPGVNLVPTNINYTVNQYSMTGDTLKFQLIPSVPVVLMGKAIRSLNFTLYRIQ